MPDERWLQMTEAAGWDLPGNNRIDESEAGVVGGRPAPAMMVSRVRVGIGALISQ